MVQGNLYRKCVTFQCVVSETCKWTFKQIKTDRQTDMYMRITIPCTPTMQGKGIKYIFIHFMQQQKTKKPLTSHDKIQYDARAISRCIHSFVLAYIHHTYTHICIHTRITTQVLRTLFKVYVKFNLQYTKR